MFHVRKETRSGGNVCLRYPRQTSAGCCRTLRELISGHGYRVRSSRVRSVEQESEVKEALKDISSSGVGKALAKRLSQIGVWSTFACCFLWTRSAYTLDNRNDTKQRPVSRDNDNQIRSDQKRRCVLSRIQLVMKECVRQNQGPGLRKSNVMPRSRKPGNLCASQDTVGRTESPRLELWRLANGRFFTLCTEMTVNMKITGAGCVLVVGPIGSDAASLAAKLGCLKQ